MVKKGTSKRVDDIEYSDSTSLIAAITSSGKVFAANTKGSVNSFISLKFIRAIVGFIEQEWNASLEKCQCILNNASIHRCKETINYMREKDIKLAFIPPYMPQMAPIEKYFARLKRMILRKILNTRMSWQSNKADNILKDCILK